MYLFLLLFSLSILSAQQDFPALGKPKQPKVKVDWTDYHSSRSLQKIADQLIAKHPRYIKKELVGRSELGKPMYNYIVSDFQYGKHTDKPAFYADANIHSNEIQGSEVVLYTMWYLVEKAKENEFIADLLKKKTFYYLTSINMDGRDHFLSKANNPHSPRSGLKALDDDMDGEINEDGPDDLDKNGHITYMIRKNPQGRWRKHEQFPEILVRAAADEFGDYDFLGSEGIDNDGDGRVNEDRDGYYDPNRDYAWNWEAGYVQFGSYKYPFSIRDSRAVHTVINKYPNIGAGFSYHNSGGIILRGPSVHGDDSYNKEDVAVMQFIGDAGVGMIPSYYVGYSLRNLYSVYGGTKDYLFAAKGIYGWTIELWSSQNLYRKKNENNREAYAKFSKELLLGDGYVPWKEYNHPTLGKIEIGGQKKFFGRVPPAFLLQEELHRNAMHAIWNAYHLAELTISDIETKALSANVHEVTVTLYNRKRFPTRSRQDVNNNITAPDKITFSGKGIKVLSSGVLTKDVNRRLIEQKRDHRSVNVDRVDGLDIERVRFIVEGKGRFRINSKSVKGGIDTKTGNL